MSDTTIACPMNSEPWRVSFNGYAIVCGEGDSRCIVASCPQIDQFNAERMADWIDRAEHIVELHNEWLKR